MYAPGKNSREETMRSFMIISALLFAQAASAQSNEKLYGSNTDVRTALTFKVDDAKLEKLVPAGWVVNSPSGGPTKGSNLGITLIDQIVQLDAEGKPLQPLKGAVFNFPGKKSGSDAAGTMVWGGLVSTAGAPGAYGVYVPARGVIDRKSRTDVAGESVIEETWQFSSDDGNAVEIQIQYVRGVPIRNKVETKVYAAAKPDFYRIYRLENLADVVKSNATGIDRVKTFSIKATGSKFGPLFDASQLISVTSLPWYTLHTYLPGS
jgi:hypothetical protein